MVEFYIDLSCSSCQSEWPTLNNVVKNYSDRVNFLYRIIPLPYHQQGFILSKAASVVNYYTSLDSVFTYFDTVYANQAQIYNSATADKTYNEVVSLVGEWATLNTGLNSKQYYEGMNQSTSIGSTCEMNTRYMFKYLTLHDVYATPTYSINGLKVMGLDTYAQWANTLDTLLAA